MNDELLIKDFIAGNVAAFNTLVWRYEKPIYNFTLRYLGDADQAKDTMQQCFIRAFKSIRKLKDHTKFSTWLYQIATNLCKDELKRNKYTTYALADSPRNDDADNRQDWVILADHSHNPGQYVPREDLTRLLHRALMSIPEEQRIVIIMKQYHDLKFVEIAEILKTPTNTIKSRMYSGLEALQKILKQWGFDREDLSYEM
jgi:RNA polymerase sigma factor (sigma-70 family)